MPLSRDLDHFPWSTESERSPSEDSGRLSPRSFKVLSLSTPNLNFDESDPISKISKDANKCLDTNKTLKNKRKKYSKVKRINHVKSSSTMSETLHKSAPNLNYDELEFEEPDFAASHIPHNARQTTESKARTSKKSPNQFVDLTSLHDFLVPEPCIDHEEDSLSLLNGADVGDGVASRIQATMISSPTSVKVKASELRNMTTKEKEIKELYSRWRQKSQNVVLVDELSHSSKSKSTMTLSPKTPSSSWHKSIPDGSVNLFP